jgi:hypothetical protein
MRATLKQLAIALIGAVIARSAIADTCPITECNYLDPQFETALAQYSACQNGVMANFYKYMRFLAISYPGLVLRGPLMRTK